MERDPSIHIKESDLVIVLQEVLHNPSKPNPLRFNCEAMAKAIVDKAKSYSVPSRSITVSNDKLDKKVNKLKLAGRSNTAIFAQSLLLTRRKLKHRGIRLIKPGEPEWLNIKEVCALATEFCNEFSLKVSVGYKVYLEQGTKMMKNFSLHKFKSMHSSICDIYEAVQEIQHDKSPQKTEEIQNIYLATIAERVGYSQGYSDNPQKYRYFVQAKEAALKYGVSLKVYIASQFEAFEFKNGVPDPMQLVGTKAVDRLQKYCYEKNIRMGNKIVRVNFKDIKQNGKKRKSSN